MSEKLDKLGSDREKARQKMELAIEKFKELDRKFKEQEKCELQTIAHEYCLTPDQLVIFLERLRTSGELEVPVPEGAENNSFTYDEIEEEDAEDKDEYREDTTDDWND